MAAVAAKLRRLLIASALLAGAAGVADDTLSYVTSNQTLEDLPQEMSRYYIELDGRNELPVHWVRDDIGLQMRHVAYALGLLRGSGMASGIPSLFDKVLCRLNTHVCSPDAQGKPVWRNQRDSPLCVPAVVWTNAFNISRTDEYPNKSLAWLETKYGTCSLLGMRDCESKMTEIAKRADRDGSIDVPVLGQAALQFQGTPATVCNPGDVALNLSEHLSEKGYEYTRKLRPEQPIGHAIGADTRKMLAAHGRKTADVDVRSSRRLRDLNSSASYRTNDFSIPVSGELPRDAAGLARTAAAMEAIASAEGPGSAQDDVTPTPVDTDSSPANLAPVVAAAVLTRLTSPPVPSAPPPVAAIAALQTLTPPFSSEVLRDIELDTYFAEQIKDVHSDVMVLDFRSNRCHPLIRHAIANDPCTTDLEPTSYSLLTNALPPKKHHGTHISGLVAGTLGIGVRPNAKIHVYDLIREGEADKTIFDYKLEQVVTKAVVERSPSIRVVNLSVDFNLGRNSSIYEKLERTFENAGTVLFVTAAGDDPASLDGVCEVVPACLEAKRKGNIMVVGGAKRSTGDEWSIHEYSRYGLRVDIVAPADNVLSAASDSGALVRLSGTSQAAAMVSGVAARLFDKAAPEYSDWLPAQVKNRLKATARIFPALVGKTSSGLLAADRALDSQQVLIYEGDPPDNRLHKVRGQLLEVVDATGGKTDGFFPVTAPTLTDPHVSFCRMYRYHRQPSGDITFFYEQGSMQSLTRWLLMKPYSNAKLQITTKQLAFITVDKPNDPLLIPIRRVVDFIDKFSGARACSSFEQQ